MKAYELIERGWCREALARDTSGKHVGTNSKSACAWCAVGAIDRVYNTSPEFEAALAKLAAEIGTEEIGAWNDEPGRTASDVIEAMRRADV